MKCECIVAFFKTRYEDELNVMKPAELLCAEACVYHMDNNLLLVLRFPQPCNQELRCCCRGGIAGQGTGD